MEPVFRKLDTLRLWWGDFASIIGLFLDHEAELTFAEKIMKMEQS